MRMLFGRRAQSEAVPPAPREGGGRKYGEEQLSRAVVQHLGITLDEFEEKDAVGGYQDATADVQALAAWLHDLRAPRTNSLPPS